MQTVDRGRRVGWLAATFAALLLTGAAVAAAQVNGATLEIDRVVRDGTAVHLQVTVPPELRGMTLQSADFDVMSPEGALTSTTEHFGGDRPEIVLALDTGIGASGLAALQGAVLQFLVDLPPNVSITIASAATVAEVGTDRQAAISAVRDLSPTDPDDVDFAPVVASALLTPPIDVAPRALVVASDADVSDGAADGVDASQTRDVVWSVQLAASGRTDASLDDLASTTGGEVVPVTGPDQLLRAFDRVRSEWTGRYEVTFDAPAGGQVVLTVATPDGPLSASTDLDDAAATPSSTGPATDATTVTSPVTLAPAAPVASTDDDGTSAWWWVLGFTVLLGGWALLFGVVLRRRIGLVDPTPGPAPVPPPTGAPGAEALRRTRTPVPPPDVADPIVDLTRAHIVAPEPTVASVPSPAVRRDRTGRLAGAAEVALGELDELRRRSPSVVSASIVLAFEAAASAWLDDDEVQIADAFAVLTDDDLPVDSTLPSVLRGLRTGLLLTPACAEPDVPDHLFGAMAGAARVSRTPERGIHRGPVPAHPNAAPPPSRRGSGDLVEAARLAAEVERDGRYGRAGGVVARALLATWPSRHGHLDRCPLLLSPSASPPDGARLTDLHPTEHVDLLLWAIADAAARMITAQRATVDLVGDYYRVAEDLAPGQAALVTDLLTRQLVTVRRTGQALGTGDDASLAHIERWAASQRLDELTPGPGGIRRWLAMPIVDAVTGTLIGSGLPLEPFGVAPPSAGDRSRPDDHVVGV